MASRRTALAAFDAKLCGPISQLILRNRGAGPFGLLNMVDERCGGTFDNIDDVIPPKERAEFMAGYKAAAGFAIETLNKAPPTIASRRAGAGGGERFELSRAHWLQRVGRISEAYCAALLRMADYASLMLDVASALPDLALPSAIRS